MNLIVIILMFGVIVFVHEFGHFIFAKMNRIAVTEFSIGMGPAIAKWGKKETTYALRMLPIGGYCLMEGEAEDSDNPNAFGHKSVPARLSVSFAGPFFNFVLAFLLSILICQFYGVDPPEITEVQKNSAAAEAGLQQGDLITKINRGRIFNFRELTLYRMENDPEKPVQITYQRRGKTCETTVKMKKDPETGAYLFGISSYERKAENFGEVLKFSLYEVRFQIKSTVASVRMLITGKASKDNLMGPVGIGNMMNDVINEAKSTGSAMNVFLNIINFTVLISANLGVMNLLPIPALDGGRILFLLIEGISGKPVPKDKEAIVNAVGFVLLMLLMVFVFFNDVGNALK